LAKRHASAGDNQGLLAFDSNPAVGDLQPSKVRGAYVEPLAVRDLSVDDIKAEIQDLERGLEGATRRFEKRVARDRKRLVALKRARAGRLAGNVSGAARAPRDTEAIRARWRDLGGGYGTIRRLAEEFGCSESTVQRRLGSSATRTPPD